MADNGLAKPVFFKSDFLNNDWTRISTNQKRVAVCIIFDQNILCINRHAS